MTRRRHRRARAEARREAAAERGRPLVCAWDVSADGVARAVGWDEAQGAPPASGWRWLHLDREAPAAAQWLRSDRGVAPLVAEALLAEETRPRATAEGDGLIVVLRGIDPAADADPHDMVAVRLWSEPGRVITASSRPVKALVDLDAQFAEGRAPATPGGFIAEVATRMAALMNPTLSRLDDRLDALEEEEAGGGDPIDMRERLIKIRRDAIPLRRNIAPQRDALAALAGEGSPMLDHRDRAHLRAAADRLTRYVEDLDALRERATVLREEIAAEVAEGMERIIYVLSLAAAVFLPLSFLVGLLGVNLAGIPYADHPASFASFCVMLAGIAAIELWLLRRLRWM